LDPPQQLGVRDLVRLQQLEELSTLDLRRIDFHPLKIDPHVTFGKLHAALGILPGSHADIGP